MNTRVLPVGNHYGTAQGLLDQIQGMPGAIPEQQAPYGFPPLGSPESEQLAGILGSPAVTELPAEELEGLKWQNWATTQQFEALGPAAQREMAKLYHDNVLPYVAGSLGTPAEALQQEFVANYPQVGVLIGREPNDFDSRASAIDQYDLDLEGRDRAQAILQGTLPGASQQTAAQTMEEEWEARTGIVQNMLEMGALTDIDENALQTFVLTGDSKYLTGELRRDNLMDQTMERRAQIEAMGGLETFGQDQIDAYVLTGNASMLSPQNTAKAREAAEKETNDRKQFVRAAGNMFVEIDAAIANANQALSIAGYADEDLDPETGESRGRSIFRGELPLTGTVGAATAAMAPAGSASGDFRGYINSVQASAAFASLKRLREASQDGSSGLGQVTEREIALLIDELEPLNPRQMTDEAVVRSLMSFRTRMENIRRNLELDIAENNELLNGVTGEVIRELGVELGNATPAGAAPSEPQVLRFDENGNLIQ